MEISSRVVEMVLSKVSNNVNPNLVFILADHIHFSINRFYQNIVFKMPLFYDIQHLYPIEFDIAKDTLRLIKIKMNIELPEDEIVGIAMNIINSELTSKKDDSDLNFDKWIEIFTSIIETTMAIKISKDSFNYSRFVSHLQYLFKRIKQSKMISSDNHKMFDMMKVEYTDTYRCIERIQLYLRKEEKIELDKEEQLYLMLHINRLCNREDCNRKGITPNT
jgi:beta-glucoside operon transcriptional antiterminator